MKGDARLESEQILLCKPNARKDHSRDLQDNVVRGCSGNKSQVKTSHVGFPPAFLRVVHIKPNPPANE